MLIVVFVVGCAGIEHYEPRDNREEGPEKGLSTGSEGEWEILGPKRPETDKEEKEHPDKPTDGRQQ